jgi:hypothetical protein
MAKAAKAAPAKVEAADWDEAEAAPEIKVGDDGLVKVKCVVNTRPWTDAKALDEGEEASVSPDVAAVMLKSKQVELA